MINQMKDFLIKCFNRNHKKRPSSEELLEHPWLKTKKRPSSIYESFNFFKEDKIQVYKSGQFNPIIDPETIYCKDKFIKKISKDRLYLIKNRFPELRHPKIISSEKKIPKDKIIKLPFIK